MRAMDSYRDELDQILISTGQHYDPSMSDVFVADLGMREPDVNLEVGSGSHAWQTAQAMQLIEPVLVDAEPDLVMVVGDVNSTLAGAVVCAKLGVRLAHVEAGLRSFDRTMPEEINRMLTDRVSDILFTTEPGAEANLTAEGVDPDRIRFVGNVMIDTLTRLLTHAEGRPILRALDLIASEKAAPLPYLLVTLHRPSNVDRRDSLETIVEALAEIAVERRVVFPVHPRTRQRLEQFGLEDRLAGCRLTEPLGYLDFLALLKGASAVLTDSGGVQEETTFLGVPCLTVRPNTERPITLTHGTNRLVCSDKNSITGAVDGAFKLARSLPRSRPPLWDGRAADRIVEVLLDEI